ncbi:hypothetical protein EDD15DRAFT_2385567 [Pisolithus albus]|nr:hypothetical protein EDD15DRAFT_2385567 [Pisolithus albus]
MSLKYKIVHVFCPLQLPNGDDHSHSNELALSEAVCDSAFEFSRHLDYSAKADWEHVERLFRKLHETIRLEELDQTLLASQVESMIAGDVNAAVVFRRGAKETIAESFEVSPATAAVMGTSGKLVCSYPGPAIAIPNEVFKLSHFLCEMNRDSLDAVPTIRKAGSKVPEERDTAHPRYITELLTGILRAIGRPVKVQRISKRIGDDVVWRSSPLPWRRSSLWLMIRVTLQITLARNALGIHGYKVFILFFMVRLAREAIGHEMSDDLSRRLTKLGDAVLRVCTKIQNLLYTSDASSPTWNPLSLNFLSDTQLSLLDSHKYITTILNPSHSATQPVCPMTGSRLRGSLDEFLIMTGDFFGDAYKADPPLGHCIDDWLATVLVDVTAAAKYSLAARETYKGNPEDFSRMFLTVIELWVATDKLVIRQIPMLSEYSPEIPIMLLQQLLLRDAHDIQRLCLAYDYVRKRHSGAKTDANSFADRIVDAAHRVRQEKVKELKRRAAAMDHDYKHTKKCAKCRLEAEAKCKISARMVVFELDPPLAFNMWRSVVRLLKHPRICLGEYSALHPHYIKHTRSRVTLASDTKPFMKSHYRSAHVPTEESKVCVNNALNFYYYDDHSHASLANPFDAVDISGFCAHQLPTGPYQSLQRYLQHTTHTSNEVLCKQADCDKDLSIHEFIAYGHLRCGPSLQWLNILREIRANVLTLRHEETHMLFAQTSTQVGPVSGDGKLVWHLELQQPNFRHSLLGELETLVSTVSGNWLEGATMGTTSSLVARMLSVTSAVQDDSFQRALTLLHTIREATFCWVLELFRKIEETTGEVEKEQLRGRLRDSAAICRSTFHVGLDTARQLLDSPRALEILVCCAVVINNSTPMQFSALRGMSALLVERDCRLSWNLEEVVGNMILQGNDGIDLGIQRVWPSYRRVMRWQRINAGNRSWFTTSTPSSATQHSQQVHFDVLSVGRLPDEIRTDPLFISIFGARAPDVFPGDMAGMEYATRGLINEYRVYFRMGTDGLIIRAKKRTDTDVFELIPREKLLPDLPTALVENYVHWLNLTTRTLEARPTESLWESSPDNWRLHFSPESYSMTKGDARLFDVRSQTWRMLSERLRPLENPRNLVITLENSDSVSIDLPRYGLSFFVNDDQELECRHPRGMVYDEIQSAGTLIGLVNKLVLRPKANLDDDGAQRLVLIPEGDVSFAREGDHVKVMVDISGPASKRLQCQIFRIDTNFGCLVGNASLAVNLYRAYLHALTSKPCSVDPLTRRTGTEEALSILQSAACRSFMKIDTRCAKLLCRIAELTTPRTWYPKHLKCMQTVDWLAGLPAASQHHCFYLASSSIREIQLQLKIFHDDQCPSLLEGFPPCDDHLLRRAAIRTAALYPPTSDPPLPDNSSDSVYKARDTQKTANLLGVVRAFPLRYNREWLSPDLPAIWLSLYDSCRRCETRQHRFQLMFSLPAMAYTSPGLEDVVHTLVAFATMPQFRDEHPPNYRVYHLSDGYTPSQHALDQLVSRREIPHREGVRRRKYKERLAREKSELITQAIVTWPCMNPPPSSNFLDSSRYDTDALDSDLHQLFASCRRNMELKTHLNRVESILGQKAASFPESFDQEATLPTNQPLAYSFVPTNQGHRHANRDMTLEILFRRAAPVLPLKEPVPYPVPRSFTLYISIILTFTYLSESMQMNRLINDLHRNANSAFQVVYANGLQRSFRYLSHDQITLGVQGLTHLVERRYMSALRLLAKCLGPQTTSEQAVYRSGQWPRITVKVLLGCLSSTSQIPLSHDWRLALEYQCARRMLALARNGQAEDLYKEMENTGRDNWQVESQADWLLIQLDGDFLIRQVQNTVLQLNMGEGKSSVIVPATASALADGNQLVRVVVPKALASQMFHLLVHRLGGLVNRRVFYLPFSRSLHIDHSGSGTIQQILEQCVRERGILVVQPEHILSFKLLSVEKQFGTSTDIAEQLLQTQRWLHSHARDILDESDEILHVRNQLIYSIGPQRSLEGSSTRWSTTQQILHLVKRHAAVLHADFPLGVEYEQHSRNSRAFPRLRILHEEAGKALVSRIAQDVMGGWLLNSTRARRAERTAIHHFITHVDVAPSEVQMLRDYCGDTTMWLTLLHLRGLLASGILLFALTERRWRVNYGLAPSRTMLAVPYRAKDVPAPRAEFSHPDVAIVLTCLSYYYGGLDREQLMLCFEHLLMLDNPEQEYESWVHDCPEVPEYLRQISGINTQSLDQWNQYLFPMFSCNQTTVDFYLSQVVFPKEAREFPSKLSSCGWDLAEKREHVTTGFSGTNDARYLLPISTTQRDLDHQRATNAKVLSYLMRPENDAYVQTSWPDSRRRTASELLTLVVEQTPEIRVILDVGAQVLELQNYELAANWLELKPDALAAIYFDDEDELTVLSREGTTQSLLESPYASRLDECIVYLDDAHTRGTDIKFPAGFRAAVTLGPKVTKDRLTQGCMRMRKLGRSHSVMFFAPLEVDRSIRDAARKSGADVIHSSDILLRAMGETCAEIQNSAPYWAQQGRDHTLRYGAWSKFCCGKITSKELATIWCQPDAKTLEELYAPSTPKEQPFLFVPEIDQRCRELGVPSSLDSNMNEEQEREIVHEMERERQVERPPPAIPAAHQIYAHLRHFVRTGVVTPRSTAFVLIFDSFRDATPLAQEFETVWSRRIFATLDYCTVVEGRSQANIGEYVRPVNWILSSQSGGNTTLVILSPFEVDSSRSVCLHIYTPRTQARMRPCDDLRLYTTPSAPSNPVSPALLMDQINLFAGQLYLSDYNTYLRLCRFLCIYADDLRAGEEDLEVESDGFIAPANRRSKAQSTGSFHKSPLPFLKHVINLRRRGVNFVATHMGRILNGRSLKEEDFENQWETQYVVPVS